MPYDPNFGTLTDDELLSLGQQAGYIPAPAEPMAPPAPDALGQSLTPPSYQLQSPGEVSGSPVRTSVGVGYGNRSFNPDKYGQVSKTEPGLEGDYQRADNQAYQGAARDAGFAGMGLDAEREAQKNIANATIDQIKGKGEQALVMQRLQDGFSVEEAKANAEASAASNQAKTDYLAALADFRAAKVDPAQLWGNMGGGDRIGMLATAFVHDFLGAKGIHTSAMDTFNKAIDRNIDAQIQAIKVKGEVAEGFKSLWYMQRNQSASDAEARERVRGFMLEGAKNAVIANMAQYESALASAQGQAAVAKIDEELGKTLIEIYRHADTNAIHLRNQALEKWKAKLQASIEQQNVNLRAQELEEARKKNAQEKMTSLVPIYDPVSGNAKWVFDPTLQLKPEEMGKIREQFASTDAVNQALNELRELSRKGKTTFDPIAGTRFAGTDAQRFDALANRIAHGMAKANGERATDQDVEQFKKGFRQNTFLNMADAEKVIAATQAQVLRQTDSLVRTYAKDIPEEMRGKFGKSARGITFEEDQIDAKSTINPAPLSAQERILQEAGKYLAPHGATDSIADDEEILTEGIKEAKNKFVQENPQFAPGPAAAPTPTDQLMNVTPPAPETDILSSDKGLIMLARAAQGGNARAFEMLRQEAGPVINSGTGSNDERAMFAAFLLNEISPGSGTNRNTKQDY